MTKTIPTPSRKPVPNTSETMEMCHVSTQVTPYRCLYCGYEFKTGESLPSKPNSPQCKIEEKAWLQNRAPARSADT